MVNGTPTVNCCRKLCPFPGVWVPKLLLFARPETTPSEAMPAGMVFCTAHMHETTTVDHVLTEIGWFTLVAGFRAKGSAAPDKKLTRLGWTRV